MTTLNELQVQATKQLNDTSKQELHGLIHMINRMSKQGYQVQVSNKSGVVTFVKGCEVVTCTWNGNSWLPVVSNSLQD